MADIIAIIFKKPQVLQDQVVLLLFIMPINAHPSMQAWEFLELQCDEELMKLHYRISIKKAEEA
jgi:hypothetical protein